MEGRNERGKEPRAAFLCPGRGGVSPPHGSFCTLAVTQAPTGTAARGPGTPILRRRCPVPACPFPVASLRAAPDHPRAPRVGCGPARAPELRAWGCPRPTAPPAGSAGRHGQRRRFILNPVMFPVRGRHLSRNKKRQGKKKKTGKKRQSSSSLSGCGKILVSSSSQPEARLGLEVEGGLFPPQPRLPQGLPLSHSPFSSPAVMPRCG